MVFHPEGSSPKLRYRVSEPSIHDTILTARESFNHINIKGVDESHFIEAEFIPDDEDPITGTLRQTCHLRPVFKEVLTFIYHSTDLPATPEEIQAHP